MFTAFQGAWATFSSSKTAEKIERSSALSICRGLVPMILTPFLYRGTARLFGIWPPTDMMQPPHACKRHPQYQPLGQLHGDWTTAFISLVKMLTMLWYLHFSHQWIILSYATEINKLGSYFPSTYMLKSMEEFHTITHDYHIRLPHNYTWMCDIYMHDN